MDLYRVNLNLLVALDTMLAEQSVTQAAKKLYITQSAMSNNLLQLRSLFKDELLIREKRGMILTSVAKSLQPKINTVLHELNSIIVNGQSFDPATTKRTFRIAMPDYLTTILLPKLMPIIQKEAPCVKVCVAPIMVIDDFASLENKEYEFAIGKIMNDKLSMSKTLLFQDEVVCIIGEKNPLAKKKELTLKDYLSQKHIGVCAKNTGSIIEEVLSSLGKKRDIQLSLPFFIPICKMIEESDSLISAVIKSTAVAYAKKPAYVIKSLPFKVKPIEFYIAWNKDVENDAGHQWMRNKIIEIGKSLRM